MKINIPAMNENLMYENNLVESFYDTKLITEEEFKKAKDALKFLMDIHNKYPIGTKVKSQYYELELTDKYEF